jgi:hypothetical protein
MQDYNHDEDSISAATGIKVEELMRKVAEIDREEVDSFSTLTEALEIGLTKRELAFFSAKLLDDMVEALNNVDDLQTTLDKIEEATGYKGLSLRREDVPLIFREQLDELVNENNGELTREIADSIPGLREFILEHISKNEEEKDCGCNCSDCTSKDIDDKIKDALGDMSIED